MCDVPTTDVPDPAADACVAGPCRGTAPTADELTQLLEEFPDGASRNGIAARERFWADDLICRSSAGARTIKVEILESMRSPPLAEPAEPTAYSAEDIRIQEYGDTAVVAFRLVGNTGRSPRSVEYFPNTFVKRNRDWRVVAWQATRKPGPQSD